MSLETLINDGTIIEIEVTKEELNRILLDGLDVVNDPGNHVTGIGYVISESGVPAIRINVGNLGYDDVEVKLR